MGPLCYSFWLIKNLYFSLLLPMPQMPSSRQAILSNQLRDWYWNSYCSSHTFSPSCPILTYYYMHLLVLCLGCQVDLADLQYLYCRAIIIIIIIIIHVLHSPSNDSIQQYLCGYRVFSFQQISLGSFASPPTFPLHLSRCTLDQERPLFLKQSQLAGLEDVR